MTLRRRPSDILPLPLLLVSLFLACLVPYANALAGVVTVKPQMDECYLIRTPQSWSQDLKRNPRYVYGNFELLNGGKGVFTGPLVVYLSSFDLKKMLYRSRNGQTSGHFDVALEAGQKYWFCLTNKFQDDDDETREANVARKVGFSLDIVTGDEFDYTDFGGNPIDMEDETTKANREARERASEWMRLGQRLGQKLKDMKRHFDYLRIRESDNRATTERTFSDILTWTLAEAATVSMVALGQIFYFRRYLERNRSHTMLG